MDAARLGSILAAMQTPLAESSALTITGADPVYPSRLPLAEVGAVALALCGQQAARLHELRTGQGQVVTVDVLAAARMLSSLYLARLDGAPLPLSDEATVGRYRCADGGWIFLQGLFPGLRDGILEVLGCPDDRASVAAATATWPAQALEDALAQRRVSAARVRTRQEWLDHPQGQYVSGLPAVEIVRVGDSDPEPLPPGTAPLDGVRVLDLSRVLAGPTCARTLGEHGAEVLLVSGPGLPFSVPSSTDTGHGKRTCWISLDRPEGRDRLHGLVEQADVICDGYRWGSLQRRGVGLADAVARRPGIVYVSVNCYGPGGPWRDRAGWEQTAEAATGVMVEQGPDGDPRLLPTPFADYVTGYLAAYGALVALNLRASVGGSWHVRASLCQTLEWLFRVGVLPEAPPAGTPLDGGAMLAWQTELGRLDYVGPVVQMGLTPPFYRSAPVALGTHQAQWVTA
ncbi:CoA transferase [Dactylosporangium sp. NPDC051485]|uniref:CoA transferase n=1 Tax=Dactylosporangium sp. NPDC051485 TaxID=3154846 RepID=UPI0034179D10